MEAIFNRWFDCQSIQVFSGGVEFIGDQTLRSSTSALLSSERPWSSPLHMVMIETYVDKRLCRDYRQYPTCTTFQLIAMINECFVHIFHQIHLTPMDDLKNSPTICSLILSLNCARLTLSRMDCNDYTWITDRYCCKERCVSTLEYPPSVASSIPTDILQTLAYV